MHPALPLDATDEADLVGGTVAMAVSVVLFVVDTNVAVMRLTLVVLCAAHAAASASAIRHVRALLTPS